jgi:hypothetical protein
MKNRLALFFIFSMLVALPVAALEQAETKVPVFVKTAANADGFTDPSKDRQDSVKDLVKKLKDSKLVRSVNSAEEAVVTLEVLGRETKREANINTALFGQKQNKSYVTVRLSVGEYSAEFTGESGSKGVLKGYGDAAGKVVKQLDEWVTANRERLAAIKK